MRYSVQIFVNLKLTNAKTPNEYARLYKPLIENYPKYQQITKATDRIKAFANNDDYYYFIIPIEFVW